jgi:uncharacterized protein (DUF169 family)
MTATDASAHAELNELRSFAGEIERSMLLRSYPLAVKMLEKETDVPQGAVRPKRDLGYHLTQCQAFTLSRRKGMAIAMLAEDQWCWGAIMAYGLVDPRIAEQFPEISEEVKKIPLLEHGRYVGIVSAPLRDATFVPDIVIIYSNVAQLNNMLHSLSFAGEGKVSTPLYPIASCSMSVVPALSGEYAVTIPDPGELGRGLATEDEIILTLPVGEVKTLVEQLRMFRDDMHWGYKDHAFLEICPDFPRPDFYKRLFRACGLDSDDLDQPA